MCKPRLLIVPLLATVAACASPAPAPRDSAPAEPGTARPTERESAPAPSGQRLVSAMAERCSEAVGRHQNAAATQVTRGALMREDWVQVDGTMEWRGEAGVLKNAWTCDMFRGEDGVWRRKYLSFGPA